MSIAPSGTHYREISCEEVSVEGSGYKDSVFEGYENQKSVTDND